MKKIFTLNLIFLTIMSLQALIPGMFAQKVFANPQIKITEVPTAIDRHSKEKPLKVKTTILTQRAAGQDAELAENTSLNSSSVKTKRDVELTSDVDKILKEMEIDDTDPMTEQPSNPIEKAYKPVKNNFIWITFGVILFPIILFALLIKLMDLAKKRFEDEKKHGLSKEEKLLEDLEKEQKKSKKKHISLSELLGGSKPSNKVPFEDDFDRDDEDFEFMVEEVVLVEEEPENKKSVEEQKHVMITSEAEQENPQEQITSNDSDVVDSFEISETLKFLLSKKDETINLICELNNQKIVIMKLEKAQKFNKVRKIDSKPGRDVYMIKLDSWRGLIEVKENDAKYLMDI